jgi:hypothetical protein
MRDLFIAFSPKEKAIAIKRGAMMICLAEVGQFSLWADKAFIRDDATLKARTVVLQGLTEEFLAPLAANVERDDAADFIVRFGNQKLRCEIALF